MVLGFYSKTKALKKSLNRNLVFKKTCTIVNPSVDTSKLALHKANFRNRRRDNHRRHGRNGIRNNQRPVDRNPPRVIKNLFFTGGG